MCDRAELRRIATNLRMLELHESYAFFTQTFCRPLSLTPGKSPAQRLHAWQARLAAALDTTAFARLTFHCAGRGSYTFMWRVTHDALRKFGGRDIHGRMVDLAYRAFVRHCPAAMQWSHRGFDRWRIDAVAGEDVFGCALLGTRGDMRRALGEAH